VLMYLCLYNVLAIAVVIGSVMMAIGMLKASANLHNVMLLNVLKSPAAVSITL